MSAGGGEQVLAELYLVDHRHGEERSLVLRLTPRHLTLLSAEEGANGKPQGGLGGKLRALFGAKGPMTPHPLLDTEFRLDDNGVRIRMGSNATYSYADFDPREARKFLMAYLQAKGSAMKK